MFRVTHCRSQEKKQNNEVTKEIGKWFMDIGKYIATAVLVAGFFGNLGQTWIMFVVGTALTLFFVTLGIILIKNKS
jgi:uncharacterized membrane protein